MHRLRTHHAVRRVREKTDILIALAGNPNVGKSCIFTQLTGINVMTANYPGTTVDVNFGIVEYNGVKIGVMDLPGTYALSALYEDQWVARRSILEEKPDAVIVIVDASNLQRNLPLVLQLLDTGANVIVDLNMVDHAERMGLKVNHEKLSEILGVPVIPTVAIKGEGIEDLIRTAIRVAREAAYSREPKHRYSQEIESAVEKLKHAIEAKLRRKPFNLSSKAIATLLLEGDSEFISMVKEQPEGEEILKLAKHLSEMIEAKAGESISVRMARERYRIAKLVAKEVVEYRGVEISLSQKLDMILTNRLTGIPIMLIVLASMFALLVYGGGFIEKLLLEAYGGYISPVLSSFFNLVSPNESIARFLDIGINLGLEGILAVIPYILVFFIALSILEDAGYLPRIAFIMDSITHKIGLHGRATIPMLGGFGCSVPAVMATRVLSRRERYILAPLIVLIPCSAKTAVILGIIAAYLGIHYTLALYAVILALIVAVGRILHEALPGSTPSMMLEIPPLQLPMIKTVLSKTWMRMKYFVYVAIPLLLLGSLIIAALEVSGITHHIVNPLSPITSGLLGLPATAVIPLLYGFIRKEGALVLLTVIAGGSDLRAYMTPLQLFTYTLIVALYMPCIATLAVLANEFKWRKAILITIGTLLIALAMGGIVSHLNPFNLGHEWLS